MPDTSFTLCLLRAGPVQWPEAGKPFWGDLGGVQSLGQEQAGRHLLQNPLAHGPCTKSGPIPPRMQLPSLQDGAELAEIAANWGAHVLPASSLWDITNWLCSF